MSEWSVVEAKAKFSELVEKTRSSGPQTITRNGRPAVVMVSTEEWERKTARKGGLGQFFAESPLAGSGIVIERHRSGPRKLDL